MIHKEHFLKEDGQGLVEYALILGLVAIAIIGIMTIFGEQAKNVYCRTVHQLAPDADISSACQAPIAIPHFIDKGPNFINVEVEIFDPDGNQNNPYNAITKVEFYVDGKGPVKTEVEYRYCLGGNSGTNPCNNFSTSNLSSGKHKITILAYDTDGNIGRSGFSFSK